MASIQERRDKDGNLISFSIRVHRGRGLDGKQLKPYTATFEVLPTYNRIGTVTIGDAGAFELRLRSEYEYDWNTDDVKFQFKDENGVIYEKTYASLNAFYSSTGDIILEPVQ